MALPYADAVANLQAGGLTGDALTSAMSSLNNAYGVGTPTGANAGATAAAPVSTAIPTKSPTGAQTYTTPEVQTSTTNAGLTPQTPTGPAVAPNQTLPAGAPANSIIDGKGGFYTPDAYGTYTYQDGKGDSTPGQKLPANLPTAAAPAAPPQTPITNPVTPPANTTTFTLPQGNAGTTLDQYQTSIQTQLDAQKAQLAQAYQEQQANYQQEIDALNSQNDQYQQLEAAGLSAEGNSVQQEIAAKQAALTQEQAQFQQAYDAKTALISEMDGLLTTGNGIIDQMKNTTGLTSIMTPRITQTMADVTARAGVITSLLSAYDGQIGVAQNQLKSTTDALTSLYGDQITYYQNVIAFYDNAQKVNDTQLATLSSDQKTYIDAQIAMLQDNVNNTQKNVDTITAAMLDPTKALAYASAGVSLNDSPAQITAKLGTFAYSQELADTSSKMSAAGYSEQPVHGVTPVTITDSQGKTTLWYNTKQAAPKVFGSASGGYYTVSGDGTVTPLVGGGGTSSSTVGKDLSDAFAAIKAGAPPDQVRQKFLAAHPTAGSDWNNYFGSGGTATSPLTYPTPPASSSSSGFDLFKPSTWGSFFGGG